MLTQIFHSHYDQHDGWEENAMLQQARTKREREKSENGEEEEDREWTRASQKTTNISSLHASPLPCSDLLPNDMFFSLKTLQYEKEMNINTDWKTNRSKDSCISHIALRESVGWH